MTVPEHYWPGAPVTVPLAGGSVSFDYDNRFVKSLPVDSTKPSYLQSPGNDSNRPSGMDDGFDVLFEITGEGKLVDFYLVGSGDQGTACRLYRVASGSLAPMVDNGYYAGGSGLALSAGSSPGNVSALRVLLTAGVQYVLQTFSTNWSDAAETASVAAGFAAGLGGWDQNFHLEISYTPSLPDTRDGAWDVVIPSDGGTYTSPPVLNTTFGASSVDDPQGTSHIFATAWWKYQPTKDTALSVTYSVIPAAHNWFSCTAYRLDDTILTQIGVSPGPSPGTITVSSVHANDVVYIQIGATNPHNGDQSYAQKYHLSVTGAKSTFQNGPPNDLRSNATAITVDADGTYLSVDTELTYATPGRAGTYGPFVTDAEAAPLYQTAWWRYLPVASGPSTFRAHSAPADDEDARIAFLDANLNMLAVTGMSQTLAFPITAGQVYYLVLGTATPQVTLSASFGMTGPPSVANPPVNDLRPNATVVKVEDGVGQYLSVGTQLDFATPSGTGPGAGPYIPDTEASPLYQTTWWIYKPVASGYANITAHSNPTDDASVRLMVMHGLTLISLVGMSTKFTHAVTSGETYYYVLGTVGHALASASLVLDGPVTAVPGGGGPDDPTDPNDVVVPSTDIKIPGVGTIGATANSATVLALVREFSASVGKKFPQLRSGVRITGPSTISMVNPNATNTLLSVSADDLYSSASTTKGATTKALSVLRGTVTTAAGATFKTNDASILLSGWQIPDRLPCRGIGNKPVKSVNMTFTPTTFTCDVTFHVG
jgi:hypothetical protein